MARLLIQTGEAAGRAIRLPNEGALIGRGETCNVVLPDRRVSNRHAHLLVEDDAWILRDLQSANGTLVNGQPVLTARLRDGDVVQAGETALLFTLADETQPAAKAVQHTVRGERPAPAAPPTPASSVRELREGIQRELARRVVGRREAVDRLLLAVLGGGHALLEGPPGSAKTLLVESLATALGLECRQVWLTGDLTAADLVGRVRVEHDEALNPVERRFDPGPLFANVVLARTFESGAPRLRTVLLSALQDGAVTTGQERRALPNPCVLVASVGTPDADATDEALPLEQRDRFLVRVRLASPTAEEEQRILATETLRRGAVVGQVLRREDVLALRQQAAQLPLAPEVLAQAVRIVRATRPDDAESPPETRAAVRQGAGTRAAHHFVSAARAHALLRGGDAVQVDDLRAVAQAVLQHRLTLRAGAGRTAAEVVDAAVARAAAPA